MLCQFDLCHPGGHQSCKAVLKPSMLEARFMIQWDSAAPQAAQLVLVQLKIHAANLTRDQMSIQATITIA